MPKRNNRHNELKKACCDFLAVVGIRAFTVNSGDLVAILPGGRRRRVRGAPEGTADLIGWIPPNGRFLAVECKTPGDTLRPMQRLFLKDVKDGGGFAACVYSVEQLKRELVKELGIKIDD